MSVSATARQAGRVYAWSVSSRVPVLLSSSSVFPEPTAAAFEMAATVGYDGLEVMVWTDAVSQDADALRVLSDHYDVPVLSVHAPCLLVTQRVWSPDPWERLSRAAQLAETLGAPTVVVHGSHDPMMRIRNGRNLARAIEGARFIVVDGMGHDLPEPVWRPVVDAVVENAR